MDTKYRQKTGRSSCTGPKSRARIREVPRLVLLMTLLALGGVQMEAATYYVSMSGSDLNAGTQASPWRTVQKAANTLRSGDTAIVGPGNYNENVITRGSGTTDLIRFHGQGMPVLNSIVVANLSNEFRGFLIRGTAQQYAVRFNSGSSGSRLISCTMSNYASRGVGTYYAPPFANNLWIESNRFINGGNIALGLGGSGHVFTNNWMSSTNGYDAMVIMSSNTRIVGNTITNWSKPPATSQHTDIIQTFNYPDNPVLSTNVVFERNLIINCSGTQIGNIEDQQNLGNTRFWTFQNNIWVNVELAMSIYARDFYFYNNIFYKSGRNTGAPILFRSAGTGKGDGHNGRVFNNVFLECGSTATNPDIGWYGLEFATNLVADHNLVSGPAGFRTKNGFQRDGRELRGINGRDPLFVNLAGLNFRPQTNSPLVGAGLPLTGWFSNDFAGNLRQLVWDVGAYDAPTAEALPRPNSPQGLRVVDP